MSWGDWTNIQNLGERITAARSTLRYEERFYCRHDGRMVAAVVAFEGERCLWIVGGRDAHAQALITELRSVMDQWHDDADLLIEQHDEGFYDRSIRKMREYHQQISEDGNAEVPVQGLRIRDEAEFNAAQHSVGFEPFERTAVCPRCHRPSRFIVTSDGVSHLQ